jgi:hypothetical protein
MISEMLDNRDLLAMRATCRELRDGSQLALCRRFFENVSVQTSGTSSSFQALTDTLLSPNLPQAQRFATKLGVGAPIIDVGWPLDVSEMRKRLSPSVADVTRLLVAMPNLVEVFLSEAIYPKTTMLSRPAPVLLRCLAAPGPHQPRLRRLLIMGLRVDESLLLAVLKAHKHSLDDVFLSKVNMSDGHSGLGHVSSWIEIWKALHSTKLSSVGLFYMEHLSYDGEFDCIRFPDRIRTNPAIGPDGEGIGSSFINSQQVKATLEIVLRAFGVTV